MEHDPIWIMLHFTLYVPGVLLGFVAYFHIYPAALLAEIPKQEGSHAYTEIDSHLGPGHGTKTHVCPEDTSVLT